MYKDRDKLDLFIFDKDFIVGFTFKCLSDTRALFYEFDGELNFVFPELMEVSQEGNCVFSLLAVRFSPPSP